MKITLTSLLSLFGFVAWVQAAGVSVKLSDVHLCCQECVDGAKRAVAKVKDVSAVPDEDTETVTLTGPDTAALQKAADALVAAGYFGKSADSSVKLSTDTGAKGEKVQTLKVEGVHLCCGQCVSAVSRAVKSVSGATGHTAKKNAKSFEVTGDFSDKEFFDALQKNGLTGKVGK
jgi:periplasmic mercuric ion binding protein